MKIVYFSREHGIKGYDTLSISIDKVQKNGIDNIVKQIKQFNPDYIIEREFNEKGSHFENIYKQLPGYTKIFWAIDTHLNINKHIKYAKNFNYIFCAISKDVKRFNKSFWLPLYFPGNIMSCNKNPLYKLSFVGAIRQFHTLRRFYVDYLKENYVIFKEFVNNYSKMPSIMNNSEISFNCSLKDDLNFRIWEGMGYGSIVLTDFVTDIYKINGLKDRLYIYENTNQLIEIVNTIRNKDFYEKRLDNQNWIFENHMLKNRIDSMIEMINTNKQIQF